MSTVEKQAIAAFQALLDSVADPYWLENLIEIQDDFGLDNYQAFLVLTNSSYPTPKSVIDQFNRVFDSNFHL